MTPIRQTAKAVVITTSFVCAQAALAVDNPVTSTTGEKKSQTIMVLSDSELSLVTAGARSTASKVAGTVAGVILGGITYTIIYECAQRC